MATHLLHLGPLPLAILPDREAGDDMLGCVERLSWHLWSQARSWREFAILYGAKTSNADPSLQIHLCRANGANQNSVPWPPGFLPRGDFSGGPPALASTVPSAKVRLSLSPLSIVAARRRMRLSAPRTSAKPRSSAAR
jgi:hypothetical protein